MSEEKSVIVLPNRVAGEPVTAIGEKAYLSRKDVEILILPDCVRSIGSWAFSHMKNLREITLPAADIRFGKQIFLGCDRLQRVLLSGAENYEGIPFFLATMFVYFPTPELCNPVLAGSPKGQWEWLRAYDDVLRNFLEGADDNGFEPAFIGWFDVEDVDDQKTEYILGRKRDKVRLAFQRLIYGQNLSEEFHRVLVSRLLQNADIVTDLLPTVDIRYYQIWAEAGGFTRESTEQLLKCLPRELAEIRAYLLSLSEDPKKGDGFFDELEL